MTALVATAGALLVAGLIGLTLGLRKTPPPAPAPGPTGAPRLGEHTREVLSAALGIGDDELDRLAKEGVV